MPKEKNNERAWRVIKHERSGVVRQIGQDHEKSGVKRQVTNKEKSK